MRRNWWFAAALTLAHACGDEPCPAGSVAMGGRCLPADGGSDGCVTRRFFVDADGDGYGDGDAPLEACAAPPMHVEEAGDCDDTDGAVHPGAAELCNGLDDDCDGVVDEGLGAPVGPPVTLRERGAAEDQVSVTVVGEQYVVGFSSSDGRAMYVRVAADGSPVGAPVRIEPSSSTTQSDVTLAAVDDSRFVAVWREGSELRGRVVQPSDGTMLATRTIATDAAEFGHVAAVAVVDGLIVVAWRTRSGGVAGRTYDLDFSGASTVRQLFLSGVVTARPFAFAEVADASPYLVLAYVGRAGSDTTDRVYAARVSLRPLTAEPPFALSAPGRDVFAVDAVGVVDSGAPAVGVAVEYGTDPALELLVLVPGSFASPLTVARTVPFDDGALSPGTDVGLSWAHGRIDVAMAGTSDGRTFQAHWATAAGEEAGDAASFGGAAFIGGLDVARLSPTEAAVAYAATPLGSTPPADLFLMRIGCE